MTNDIKSSIEKYTKNMISSASNLVGMNATDYAKNLKETASTFVQTANTSLSTITSKLGKIDATLPDINSALNKQTGPISFVSNIVKDNESIIGSMTDNLSAGLDNISKFDSNALKTIASRSGITSLSNDLDLSNAFKNISSSYKSISSEASSFTKLLNDVSSTASTVVSNITNGISNTISFVTNGIGSIVGSVTDTVGNVLSDIKNSSIGKTVSNILGSIPDSLTKLINPNSSSSSIDFDKIIGSITSKVNLGDTSNFIEQMLDIDSNYFNKITNELGTSQLPGTSRSSYSTLDKISKLAKELCDGFEFEAFDFSKMKSLFDALLQAALDAGLSDILKLLSACSKYFDSSSIDLVKRNLNKVSYTGDTRSLRQMVDITGVGAVRNVEELLLTASANMTPDDDYSDLQSLASSFNYDLTSLFKEKSINNIPINNSFTTALLHESGISNKVLGNDKTNKVLTLAEKYIAV